MYDFGAALKKKLAEFSELYLDLREQNEALSLSEFVEYMIKKVGFEASFDLSNDEEYNKMQNIREFCNAVNDFEESNPDATLSDYLESITLVSDIDSVGEEEEYCLLSTIHAVKGLEFKIVFVIAMEEGLFPIVRGGERPSDIEEERRLAYVAVTRAEEKLYLTRSRQRFMYNEVKYKDASRFLKEMGFEEMNLKNLDKMVDVGKEVYPTKKVDTTQSIQSLMNKKLTNQQKDFSEYKKGQQVLHSKFGVGVIVDDCCLHQKTVTIDFGGLGHKTLSLEYAPLQLLKRKGE